MSRRLVEQLTSHDKIRNTVTLDLPQESRLRMLTRSNMTLFAKSKSSGRGNFFSRQTLTVQGFLGLLDARNFSNWRAERDDDYVAVIAITIALFYWN
jgi:hypothetical protein